MIAIVQGSNRAGNTTQAVTTFVAEHLQAKGLAAEVIDLADMPSEVLHTNMYEAGRAQAFLDDAEQLLLSANRWVFAFPEYNGSYPGALKLFIDALSVREYKKLFGQRLTALIGTASGRAGNLRGIDHFTGVMHHMGAIVMPQALPISLIDGLLDGDKALVEAKARKTLGAYVDRFVDFSVGDPVLV